METKVNCKVEELPKKLKEIEYIWDKTEGNSVMDEMKKVTYVPVETHYIRNEKIDNFLSQFDCPSRPAPNDEIKRSLPKVVNHFILLHDMNNFPMYIDIHTIEMFNDFHVVTNSYVGQTTYQIRESIFEIADLIGEYYDL